MPPKLIDPLQALAESRQASDMPSAAEVVRASVRPPLARREDPKASTSLSTPEPTLSLEDRAKKDFRVFLTLVWRFLLKVDPSAIQLDMAYWLQHGPSRAIIMAFRGFSKSWITGAYALWRLYVDPDEKVMVVSGSLQRSIATVNWALSLIMQMPLLKHMQPKPSYRASSMQFDVGSCENIGQSASFSAFGIGGQLVGFRGTCIIPDDVETQTNSLTVVMREKIEEAVKEFESVLVPGGVIKYLGTPHDVDSLYMKLLRLKDDHKRPVYTARIWPALFPTEEQIKGYGINLAPYITHCIKKQGPSVVGHSTMPNRFTDDDLAMRRAAIGKSEFALQFLLDLKGSFVDRYPLKLKDLTVMPLDDLAGPEEVVWGNTQIDRDLPVMGFDGDFYHKPSFVGPNYAPYTRAIGYVDGSGRGSDETALSIVAELFGRLYWLHLWASQDGYGVATLGAIAAACVRFRVSTLYIEANYGDGMLPALLKPVLARYWQDANGKAIKASTKLEEVKSGRVEKEKRILSVLEPLTQQHRIVVSRAVIEHDARSIMEMDGEESRHRYAWGYQYTHLTAERDCLGKDDRIESLAGACGIFAPQLGVDPRGMALRAAEEREEDELEKLLRESDEAVFAGGRNGKRDNRSNAVKISKR
jgi:hypothetical protein